MNVPAHLIPGIAVLLRYPGEHTQAVAGSLADAAMATGHPCQEHLEAFALVVRSLDLREVQELYTRSFDLNPECSLDIGWHLFGETYQRGQFMAMMRHHLQEHGIEEGKNLPDHLPNLLDLGMKLDTADAMDLVDDCILPTLEKLLPSMRPKQDAEGHGAERRPQGGSTGGAAMKESIYLHVLQALYLIFTVDRKPAEAACAD
ncbi:MAG TPA: molecular chaperone TorD family protein [Geothrix sp.]|nr:molecular chaperone TorD family protein [Geothrix sp.]